MEQIKIIKIRGRGKAEINEYSYIRARKAKKELLSLAIENANKTAKKYQE